MNKIEKLLLGGIISLAFILRFYHLNFQSLWLDELHTMIEADPKLTFKGLFDYLKCCDQHPPLFFIIEKIAFTIFGHTEFVARFITATAGTLSVYIMFLLGKEMATKNVGFIAAIIASINFFNIQYSQEARGYILAFLFVCLSFLYLVKFIKNQSFKTGAYYSLFTLLLLYTHYYGLFVFVSQCVIGLIYWAVISSEKTKFFTSMALAFLTIVIGFAPWIPFLLEMTKLKSFWITGISPAFAQDYFLEYFGNNNLLYPFLALFILLYLFKVLTNKDLDIRSNQVLGFTIIITWVFITLIIPYLRSVLTVPMLFPRYTIVVLPAFLLVLALGIDAIPNKLIKGLVLSIFITLSLIDLLAAKKYYTTVNKTQFREITSFIANYKTKNLPILSFKTAWHFQYYAKAFNIGAPVLDADSQPIMDSVINSPNNMGFWLVGTHNSSKMSAEKLKQLESTYVLVEDNSYFDGWAQLFLPYNSMQGTKELVFDKSLWFDVNNENVVSLWGAKLNANSIILEKGKYNLKIISRGTKANNEYPKVNIIANGKKIGEYTSTENKGQVNIQFECNSEPVTFIFEMTNDYTNPETKEDRNLFISKAFVSPIN